MSLLPIVLYILVPFVFLPVVLALTLRLENPQKIITKAVLCNEMQQSKQEVLGVAETGRLGPLGQEKQTNPSEGMSFVPLHSHWEGAVSIK